MDSFIEPVFFEALQILFRLKIEFHISNLWGIFLLVDYHLVNNANDEAFLASSRIEEVLANDDGLAAREHLAAGYPIYYGDDRYPDDIIKEYPDGRQQLVTVTSTGQIVIIRDL
jgi:hypothetical protein